MRPFSDEAAAHEDVLVCESSSKKNGKRRLPWICAALKESFVVYSSEIEIFSDDDKGNSLDLFQYRHYPFYGIQSIQHFGFCEVRNSRKMSYLMKDYFDTSVSGGE